MDGRLMAVVWCPDVSHYHCALRAAVADLQAAGADVGPGRVRHHTVTGDAADEAITEWLIRGHFVDLGAAVLYADSVRLYLARRPGSLLMVATTAASVPA